MNHYIITRKSTGHTLGVYAGETPAEALDATCRDAGYRDHAHACEVSGDHTSVDDFNFEAQ